MKERFVFSMFFYRIFSGIHMENFVDHLEQRINIRESFLLLNAPNFTLYIRKTNSESNLDTIFIDEASIQYIIFCKDGCLE